MAEYPPFMNAYGLIPKILAKIKEAQTPARFTQDFLSTKLGFPGGSARSFIPLAKRLGLLASDGSPTELYKSLRNPGQSKAAMAVAIRKGYPDLYSRNEYAHDLDKKKLEGLILEATGLEHGHATARAVSGTFQALKALADFDKKPGEETTKRRDETPPDRQLPGGKEGEAVDIKLAYTINLVLPKTDDIAVFNAIFRSLRENLLRK